MSTILILNPDAKYAREIRRGLSANGYRCKALQDAVEGFDYALDQSDLLLVLSTRYPWRTCRDLLALCGSRGWPVLFLAEDDTNAGHLRALKQAKCEVLVHPFGPQEMVVAVKRLMLQGEEALQVGELAMDLIFQTATYHGKPIVLTTQEFSLLEVLLRSPEEVIDRDTLLREAWGYEGGYETRTVDVHIQRLRRKLGKDTIETVYKQGYRLVGGML